MRYTVLLYEDPEEHLFVVIVPDLPGCVTQAETVDAALANAHEAIEGHLASMAAHGEDLPEETIPPIIASIEVADPRESLAQEEHAAAR